MTHEHFDVIIIGAGLSGIGAACHLQRLCPGKRYLILESREDMGGTWDLFRYPGIRSDSDMHTLGYNFKPWVAEKAIAEGPAILEYIHEAARENQVEKNIRYRQRMTRARWSSADATWRVTAEDQGQGSATEITCNFLLMCAGYYRYREGFTPDFPGRELFRGTIVHPQLWPEDLDYRGKQVVIIGSGATAVTLLPAMAEDAAHVTMLQRSPTYMFSWPFRDAVATTLRRFLPERWAYAITRWKNITAQAWVYRKSRTDPEAVRKRLLDGIRQELGTDYDIETDFTPSYKPWDQRLCLVPDSDLFESLKSGKSSIVTDQIERITENGILLRSGRELAADIIVTATGLNMVAMGEAEFEVDGVPVNFADTWTYKGIMYSGVPNLISTFGYINASWTLRADLSSEYFCRLLNHMDATGAQQVMPALRAEDADMPARPWIDDFSSGYMRRAMHLFPKQGDREPWVNTQDYRRDKKLLRDASFDDGVLVFSRARAQPSAAAA
jgi:cation diffusion facilitator CzcD-associated flavoprotein CzcO